MVERETELVDSVDELCSDAACGDESCTSGVADDVVGSFGVCKVGLLVLPMMAPSADVGVVGNSSND